MRSRPHGSVLLLVIIVLAVLMVAGAGLVYRGTIERASAHAHSQHEEVTLCARAAYGVLWTDYVASGADPYTAMPRLEMPDPGDPTNADKKLVLDLGHFDQSPDAGSYDYQNIKVRLDPDATAGVDMGETESTNTFRQGLGGDPYRFVAHCTYPSGAQHEVEFLVRLGL